MTRVVGDWSAVCTYYFTRCLVSVCCFTVHPGVQRVQQLEMSFTYVQLFVAFLLSAIVYRLLQGRRRPRLPFPPGPKGHPLIGNLRDMPAQYQWLKYEEWGNDLGKRCSFPVTETHQPRLGSGILHLQFFGTHVIVLNTEKAATDLLDRRSAIYSDRCVIQGYLT